MISRGSFVAAVALAAAACREPAPPTEIRIGLLVTLDGVPGDSSGRPSVEGAELAVREANEAGGVVLAGKRHQVQLIVKGYEDRPDSATSVARTLINQAHIDVLVGPQFSRHAIPVALVAEDAQIPMVSPMSSSPATTEGKRFVFRLASLDETHGTVMGHFAASELGARRAAVLYDVSTDYSRSLAEAFRRAFEEDGGKVVAYETFARDEPLVYGDRLARVAEVSPEVLYLPNDGERVEAQIVQSRQQGIRAILIGGDTWDLERFRTMPESDESYVAHQWHPDLDTPEARRYRKLYEEAHGKLPKVTSAMTYDAIRLVLAAIARGGNLDSSVIRDELEKTRSYSGATGAISYEHGHDPVRSVVIARLSRGRSSLYRVVDPSSSQP